MKPFITSLILIICIESKSQEIKASWKPPFLPIQISIDKNWNVDISASGSFVTPLGTFGLEASIPINKSKTDNPETKNVTVENIKYISNNNFVILRDNIYNKQKIYEINSDKKLRVLTDGQTMFTVDKNTITIDVSLGNSVNVEIREYNSDFEYQDKYSAKFCLDTANKLIEKYLLSQTNELGDNIYYWMAKAALKGNPEAQYKVAEYILERTNRVVLCSEPKCHERYTEVAVQWLKKSANQKYPEACVVLGYLYCIGFDGVNGRIQNKIESKRLYQIAKEINAPGYKEAIENCN